MRTLVTALLAIGLVLPAAAARQPRANAAQKCTAAKLKAAGKKADQKLVCFSKTAGKGAAPDQACLRRAEQKFRAAFTKIEAKGGCTTTGDAAAIETTVDDFVASIVAALTTGGTSTTTTTTSPGGSTTTSPAAVKLSTDVQPIFDAQCTSCHSGPSADAGLDLSAGQSHAALVGKSSTQCPSMQLVAAGSAQTSYLVSKLNGAGTCFLGTIMPPSGSLPAGDIAKISAWITEGAPNN